MDNFGRWMCCCCSFFFFVTPYLIIRIRREKEKGETGHRGKYHRKGDENIHEIWYLHYPPLGTHDFFLTLPIDLLSIRHSLFSLSFRVTCFSFLHFYPFHCSCTRERVNESNVYGVLFCFVVVCFVDAHVSASSTISDSFSTSFLTCVNEICSLDFSLYYCHVNAQTTPQN
uniref:Uncharacterized protein TCIL3000_7_2280 n=1 Tax=Trypanosoma congolense (strain IL3000) TaxID=1068625 RepID=G0UPV7_TRYCI|nr:unnamed protein product [Trypanosoma congolense IL3000]